MTTTMVRSPGGRPAGPGPRGVDRLLPIDRVTGGVRDLTSLADHLAEHGPVPTVAGPRDGAPGPLATVVEQAGLRGRGGGWFPTAVKLQAVTAAAARRRTPAGRTPVVLGNGMEGEPASDKDLVLMTRAPHLVLDGLVLAAVTVGAREATVVGHEDSPGLARLQAAVAERRGWHADPVALRVAGAPARYVASEESALARWAGGGPALPVSGPRPTERGVRGRPTLVQNVETLAHLALIARYGATWFRTLGDPAAPGSTLVTVSGAVAHGGVLEVAVGTPVADILARCGGPTGPLRAVLTGGYGGSWVAADRLLDRRWTPEEVRAVGGVVGAGVLVALPEGVCGLALTARIAAWLADQSAGQCGPCRFGLPAVADDLARLLEGPSDRRIRTQLLERLTLLPGRGACRHPDGGARLVGSALEVFAEELGATPDHGTPHHTRRIR